MSNIKEFMFNKNPMLVLSYLSKNIFKDNISLNIAKELCLVKGSVHAILKQFEIIGIVEISLTRTGRLISIYVLE